MKKQKPTVNFRAIVRESRNFAVAIDRLKELGYSGGKAILLARKADPEGYNRWQSWRQKTDCGRNLQFL